MTPILPFKRYTPESWPFGYDGSGNQPQFDTPEVDAWFGVPVYLNDLDYWVAKTSLPLKQFFPLSPGFLLIGSVYVSVPNDALLWCKESSPVDVKSHVNRVNSERVKPLLTLIKNLIENVPEKSAVEKLLESIKQSSLVFDFQKTVALYPKTKKTTSITRGSITSDILSRAEYVTAKINVADGIYKLVSDFVSVNGRAPNKIFADNYASDFSIQNVDFNLTPDGYACPEWAAFSMIASNKTDKIRASDSGTVFVNQFEAHNFRSAFWWRVAAESGHLLIERDAYVFRGFVDAGRDLVDGYSLDAVLIDSYRVGYDYKNIDYFFPVAVVEKVAAFYKTKLDEIHAEILRIWRDQSMWVGFRDALIQGVLRAASLYAQTMTFSNISTVFGELTFASVTNGLKIAQALGIVDLQKELAFANFGSSVYNLAQKSIDNIAEAIPENSGDIDAGAGELYTLPTVQPDNIMDIDWDAWLDGQTALEQAAGLDFSGYDENVFDWSSVDFSGVTAFDFEPFDWGSMGSDTPFDPAFAEGAGMEWAMVAPDMSVNQLAAVNEIDEATRAEAVEIVNSAQQTAAATGTDFLTVLGNTVKNIQGATGAFLTLYTTYKKAEQVIKNGGGNVTSKPPTVSRPTRPGQSTRQPDGSISTMLSDGSIRTVRPDGSIVLSGPNAALPSFNTLFSKQNLLIAGGVAVAVYAVTALRKGK